jgi:citronellol/citronellal dehydrogenase
VVDAAGAEAGLGGDEPAALLADDVGDRAVVGDVRRDEDVQRAFDAAVERFGGIDVVVNKASALDLRPTREIDLKSYDLMRDINARGSLCSESIPQLEKSDRAHVLALPPPIDLRPQWAGSYLPYTMAKYGMSRDPRPRGGAARRWHCGGLARRRTTIATAAVANLLGGEDTVGRSRTPDLMADAAHAVLVRDSRTCTGNFSIDEDVLREEGVTDLDRYRVVPGGPPLEADLFLDPVEEQV